MKPLPAAKPSEPLGQKPAWLAAGMGFVMVFALLAELHHRHWHGWEISAMVVSLIAIAGCFSIANGPDLLANWRIIRPDRRLRLGTIAVNYFWFMGAILQLNIFLYAKDIMDVSDKMASLLVMAVAIGIGLGSYLCGRLSHGQVKIPFVFLGALGMSLFAIDLLWAYTSLARAFFDFFMLGAAGGFYDIPLMALVQARSPEAERGRIMATINFFSFIAILFASGVLWFLSNVLHQNPAQVFFALGTTSLAVVIVVYVNKYGVPSFKKAT
jgi:MFS family permease